MADMRRSTKRIAVAVCFSFFVVTILLIYNWKPGHHHKNPFEIDIYDDGDYDEDAKDAILRRHLIDYPLFNFKVQKEVRRPPAIVPQILVKKVQPITVTPSMSDAEVENNFFRYIETKDVICKNDKRLGFQHDGGYNVCFAPPFGLKKPCIVYSFGIYDDWNFDDAVSKIFKCNVFSFDPSISQSDHNRSSLIKFRKIGIGTKNGVNRKGWTLKTLGSILRRNHHEKTVIDYLKFDIEYDEWTVLQALHEEGSLWNVKQIGFEIHTNELFRQKDLPLRTTTKHDYIRMYKILQTLDRMNFKQFNYRLNPFGMFKSKVTNITRSCCYDIHFMNMNFVKKNYTIVES
ncbi:methyltransferase-like protein 24 [Mizuhopecten yessoensis]|uniref:Methyltransferase-like protein 24 n=1 Tax=Mizuhopecten yessoensis TaxID=6573 RepID=A0A210PKU4_MIZYE|nr:methyltransferase-like protein 24 [Mizuhopecten yessoensis]OWF37111.1 Methyltransferase-like protein 24 [Mizuhopecten yessoensis]